MINYRELNIVKTGIRPKHKLSLVAGLNNLNSFFPFNLYEMLHPDVRQQNPEKATIIAVINQSNLAKSQTCGLFAFRLHN